MKKVALLTSHYFFSERKAGFHFLAQEYLKMGYEVTFITILFSPLYFLSKNHLIYEPDIFKNILKPIQKENLISMVNATFLHPTPKFGNLEFGYFLQNRIKKKLKEMDYIIFESNESLLFFNEIKRINPNSKMIYRVSDDITLLSSSSKLIQTEKEILSKFNLVSVPSIAIFNRLTKISNNNLYLHHHGIDKKIFDECIENPYRDNKINLVFVGQSHFDMGFLRIATKIFPDYIFHIIGNIKKDIDRENIVFYGHMPFKKTIPYVKFADIGLITRTGDKGLVKTLSDSLKVLQYSYCKLPLIAPRVMKSDRKNWFSYDLEEESIKTAIKSALEFDREKFDNSDIYDWNFLAKKLIGENN